MENPEWGLCWRVEHQLYKESTQNLESWAMLRCRSSSLDLHGAATDKQHVDMLEQSQVSNPLEEQAATLKTQPG